MANDKIDNEFFATILRIQKSSNPADLDSICKGIKKSLNFEDATQEFLDDRIHTLINDRKIVNRSNQNTDYYKVNSKLVDLETHNLLNSSQSTQRITLIPADSLSNSIVTPALSVNKTLQLEGVILTPTDYISNSSEDKPELNVNETPVD